MKSHPIFRAVWIVADAVLVVSLLLLILGVAWEYSTRRYLKGFADAVVPLSVSPGQKVDAILDWMRHGPARQDASTTTDLALRDPQNTLNYQQLLRVCGTATNAFINLATASGLPARRLLLLGPDQRSRHVVAEVRLDGRWVVVDPVFRAVFRDARGEILTREQLRDSRVFLEAIQRILGYPHEYAFDTTVHVRLARVPVIGSLLRKTLDSVAPGWEEALNWTLVLERESLALALSALVLLCWMLFCRAVFAWYAEKRLGIHRVRLRDQLLRAGETLFSGSG